MKYAVSPAPVYTLPVAGSDEQFPVNRIFCVGRNYAAHAREMGKDPDRDPPFFFMKPANAVVVAGTDEVTIPYPPKTANFHHEIELVVAIGTGGADIPVEKALEHVYGYAVGLDMTRRDVQLEARDKGRPWEFGKSFAKSAPIGPIHKAADVGHVSEGAIAVTVNGEPRQHSDIAKLIWSVAESIAFLSEYETLEPGDIIMTGTPEGVNAVKPGDLMVGTVAGLGEIRVRVAG
ncbi:fumarylacetoacetate hydrolase family protein [Massilia sp. TW-1]|uniref:Fumarylacetoacetate hydrolase family protein n=1 Tax=Telluria antibiotica TaxID=2717319 RepID=A0ABX0PLY1_9BURK|nr:fumarylacetoacetate hydrolase family protein [Telluria antibiotica]NIA56905.1 fumarylacetoacetate hydrolase family protein [Telluria antibiotica]